MSYEQPNVFPENSAVNHEPTASDIQEPSILEIIHNEHPEIEERPYQIECLNILQQVRDEGKRTALVQMATGLGKTTVVASDVSSFLRQQPDAKVLFLCHQNDILEQARVRFEDILGAESHTFGTYNGRSKAGRDKTCMFASFQTMKNKLETFDRDEFDYIVVDESHHGKADTYEPVIRHFEPQFLLGVTATPDRNDLQDIRDLFGEEVYSKSLAEALGEGLLAQPDYRVILDDIENELPEEDGLTLGELNRTFFIPKRDEEVAAIISERLAAIEQPKTIIFCPSIEHTERMQQHIEGSQVINSAMSPTERQQTMEAFRRGDISAVLTVDLFNEGVDVADANAIVFLRSTQSETIFLQQLGRGLRKTATKDSVLVLDFVANVDRLLMIEKLLYDAVDQNRRIRHDGQSGSSNINKDADDNTASDEDIFSTVRELNLGQFNFTETSRKLLEIIHRMPRLARNYEPVQEGWEYVGSLADELSTTRSHIMKLASTANLVGQNMVGIKRGKVGLYYSPEDVQTIKTLFENQTGEPAPDGWLSSIGMQKLYKISPYSVQNTAQKLGINGRMYVTRTRQEGTFYSSEEQAQIINAYNSVPMHEEGWLTPTGLAEQLQVSLSRVRQVASDLDITPVERKNKYGHVVDHFSIADQKAIAEHATATENVIPEHWITAVGILRAHGLHPRTVTKLAGELGIKGVSMPNHLGRLAIFYSPEETNRILEHAPARSTAEKVPEGYVSVTDLAKDLTISPETVAKRVAQKEAAISIYKNARGRDTRYISEAVASILRDEVGQTTTAPKGYASFRGFARQQGVAETTIKRIVDEQNIKALPYRDTVSGNVFDFLNPEQQAMVLKDPFFTTTSAPDGYRTRVDVAQELGISKDTVKVIATELGIEIGRFKSTRSNRVADFLSPDQITALRNSERVKALQNKG